ncbi:MAG: hypothetical protein IIV90_06240, partial [Oscillospiraceae bacterium]|nr:hypothetical protein [Oscillospiraceae bacterium]
RLIRHTVGFDPAMNYLRLLIAWCQFAVMLGLILATVWHFRRQKRWGKKPLVGAAALWLAWWGLPRLAALLIPRPDEYYFSSWYNFLMIGQDGVQLVLFAAAAVLTAALFRGWRAHCQK